MQEVKGVCDTLWFQCSADLKAFLVTGLNFTHLYLDSRLFPPSVLVSSTFVSQI